MKNKITKWSFGAAGIMLLLTFFACSKKDQPNTAQPGPDQNKLSVYLTDGPGYFDQVLVDIQSIAVKVDTSMHWWGKGDHDDHDHHGDDHHGDDDHDDDDAWGNHWSNKDKHDRGAIWDTLDITPGIYDLLNFANGADTLLSSDNIPKGRVIAFRITLGDQNSLVKDSITYPLHLPANWKTVYLRVFGANFGQLSSNHYKIWIDFDAGRSVVKVHDGMFYLRPVLRAFAVSNTGGIRGFIHPQDAFSVVSVYNGNDTLYAIPGKHGMFMVRGLPEGAYKLFVNASNGYQDTTLTDVEVKVGQTENVGEIKLHK